MSIHSTFAANLRGKCYEHGTIADICRGIGMNRQQFNKYLAGTSIPNAVTLRKICGFLGVEEQSLFMSARVISGQNMFSAVSAKRRPFELETLNREHYDANVEDFPCGYYHTYMPLPSVPDFLVRSLLYVFQTGRQKEFVRLTRFPSFDRNSKSTNRGRHKGIVFANNSEIYFLGFNRYPPFQCSFMSLVRGYRSSNDFYEGSVITNSLNAPLSTRVYISVASPFTTNRQKIENLGHIHADQTGLDLVALSTLQG